MLFLYIYTVKIPYNNIAKQIYNNVENTIILTFLLRFPLERHFCTDRQAAQAFITKNIFIFSNRYQ